VSEKGVVNSGLASRLKIALPVTALLTGSIFYYQKVTSFFIIAILLRSLWEYYQVFKVKITARLKLSMGFSLLYLLACATPGFDLRAPMLLLGFFGLFSCQLFIPKSNEAMLQSNQTLMGFTFVTILGEHALRLYLMDYGGTDSNWGAQLFFASVFTCKFTDATAYFAGKKYGKTKLIPKISPNKTWEGLYGAYAGGLLCLPLFMIIPGFNFLIALGIAFAVVSVATLGDLFESQFKRELNVKDTANDIPGFGGTLDMIDSVLWVMPMVYWTVFSCGIHIPQKL
jgi:phosphatidate cytidylyltransferase